MSHICSFWAFSWERIGGIGWTNLVISEEIKKVNFSIRKLSSHWAGGYPWLLCSQTFLVIQGPIVLEVDWPWNLNCSTIASYKCLAFCKEITKFLLPLCVLRANSEKVSIPGCSERWKNPTRTHNPTLFLQKLFIGNVELHANFTQFLLLLLKTPGSLNLGYTPVHDGTFAITR